VHHPSHLYGLKRPILDRLASFVFKLENDRVSSASVLDEKGRSGEPMEWAEENSFANQLSQIVSNNDIGYTFKQTVADLVAGQYDREARAKSITSFIEEHAVAMYSFTTCPFCRKAKDYLDENSIPYQAIELDLLPGNEGNEIRSELGRMTKRTSVPSIFIGGERLLFIWFIGIVWNVSIIIYVLSFNELELCRQMYYFSSFLQQESTSGDATTDLDCFRLLVRVNWMICFRMRD
jgi:glutaredoxin 3